MSGKAGAGLRDVRIRVSQAATLVLSDGSEIEVVITDVSKGGFRLTADETFYIGENIRVGEPVVLRIERWDAIQGEIVWASGCEAGGLFSDTSQCSETQASDRR
jgi:hypothetical protein